MENKYIYLYFFIFINLTICQKITEVHIGEIIEKEMELDESHEYFKLRIPKNETGRVLILNTHEDKGKHIKDNKLFSDPDFYVSKINKYPSSPRSSEWYSEQYGSDVLTISPGDIKEDDIFYIGMYCQYKCRYHLHIYTSQEIEVYLEKYYIFNLKPHEFMTYKLFIKEDFGELKALAYSKTEGKFHFFMNSERPSAENSFKVIPSWMSGYFIPVKKGVKGYCFNCYYYILIQNENEKESNTITFYSYLKGTVSKIYKYKPIYDALNIHSKRCYKFDMSKTQKEKETLIIQPTIFSGSGDLFIEGWTSKNIEFTKDIKDKDKEYLFKIDNGNGQTFLNKTDFDHFDQEEQSYSGKDSSLNLCIYTTQKRISFSLSVYYLTQVGKLQYHEGSNILMKGHRKKGYLLKDQIIKYELAGINSEKGLYDLKTNITAVISNRVGLTKMYGYFCKERYCIFNKEKIDKLNEEKKLINSTEETPHISLLSIKSEDNICYKIPMEKLSDDEEIKCSNIIILVCEFPNEDGLCAYDISMNVLDKPLLMKPKEIYKGTLPAGKTDNYEINIVDSKINSLIVVLNSESGDAQLALYEAKRTSSNEENNKLIALSTHRDYIPDVIRITPKAIGSENLIGDYIVKVNSDYFSSYNIYYYVTYIDSDDKEVKDIVPEVTMNLEVGDVLTDYFPVDIRYKIYSFRILSEQKENIKVFINRVNVDLNLYIYSDISKFSILQLREMARGKESISGYDWKSNANSEVNILAADPNYSLKKTYYIIVEPNIDNKYVLGSLDGNEKVAFKFFLGITSESTFITITEGIPHSFTLSSNYNEQNYFYKHTNIEKNFELTINVLLGEIDIYIDTKEIDVSGINDLKDEENFDAESNIYIKGTLRYKHNIKSTEILSLSSSFFKEQNLSTSSGVKIYFFIRRSVNSFIEGKVCQYVIIEKSSDKKGEILQPGIIKTSKSKVGKPDYYIIEEVQKRKQGTINVFFQNGYGQIYVRVPLSPEINPRFPEQGNYDFIGENIFSGRMVQIPQEVYDRLNIKNRKIQILVTVSPESGYETRNNNTSNEKRDNELIYSISYSNEPKRINQNKPYDGYINKGELQYFTFYFDIDVKNIFIGLTNMNGDADMYLNYGNILPTTSKFNWNSNSMRHEYIDINLEDRFFKENKIDNLSGSYTLLIAGFTSTKFSLFISNHEKKVFPLRSNIPINCYCENENDKCYFRFDDVFVKEGGETLTKEYIFTSRYLYGNGILYAKVIKDMDLYGEGFYESFPDSQSNSDISNIESNQRNYIKVELDSEIYNIDTSILLTFVCSARTNVAITATPLRHYSFFDFLSQGRENVYYLGNSLEGDKEIELNVYLSNLDKNHDIIYSVHSYVGEAHIDVFTNSSTWDIQKQKTIYTYHYYKGFEIISMAEKNTQEHDYDYEFAEKIEENYNPFSTDYHNFITAEEKKDYDEIIFKIKPKGDFGFFIQYFFDKNWINIPIGKSNSYLVRNKEFFGYFDILDEYSDVEFNLNVERNLQMIAEVFIKINVIDTKRNEKTPGSKSIADSYHYSIPGYDNFDYRVQSDKILGQISLNINKLPKLTKEEQKYKFIRGLFYASLSSINFESLPQENQNQNNKNNKVNEEQSLISIAITPGVNSIKYVELKPNEYYFSNLTIDSSSLIKKVPETKIYSLTADSDYHDILVIEISSCLGDYEIKIHDKLVHQDSEESLVEYEETKENGKHSIFIKGLSQKHFYLSVKPKPSLFHCMILKKKKDECLSDLSYLIYYYSTYEENFAFTITEKTLEQQPYGKGKIKLNLPEIIMKDIHSQVKNISDFKFDVFATKNEEYLSSLGNVCFLSRYNLDKKDIFKLENLKIQNENVLIISDLGYRSKYYVNVLAQNIKTKELLVFDPILIWSGGYLPFPIWKTVLTYLVFCTLLFLVVLFITKYKKAQMELQIIKGETLPKTGMEMSGISESTKEKVKYSGLGDSY